jgi:hypothetical protein
MPSPIKTCLTCGKITQPTAQFCPRCGSAFLRIWPVPAAVWPHALDRLQPLSSCGPPARHWAFIAGRLLRQAWQIILAFW